MPFVPSSEAQLISEKLTLSPQDVVPEEEPTIGDIAGALFRQENMLVHGLYEPEGLPDTKDDPTLMLTLCLLKMKADEGFVTLLLC